MLKEYWPKSHGCYCTARHLYMFRVNNWNWNSNLNIFNGNESTILENKEQLKQQIFYVLFAAIELDSMWIDSNDVDWFGFHNDSFMTFEWSWYLERMKPINFWKGKAISLQMNSFGSENPSLAGQRHIFERDPIHCVWTVSFMQTKRHIDGMTWHMVNRKGTVKVWCYLWRGKLISTVMLSASIFIRTKCYLMRGNVNLTQIVETKKKARNRNKLNKHLQKTERWMSEVCIWWSSRCSILNCWIFSSVTFSVVVAVDYSHRCYTLVIDCSIYSIVLLLMNCSSFLRRTVSFN